MALMSFREPNQVKWQGVRPGHNGEQVAVGRSASAATNIMYTVPAGKTLYLTSWMFSWYGSNLGDVGSFGVYDAVPAVDYNFAGFVVRAIGQEHASWHDFYPVEIPTGYSVRIISSAVTLTVRSFIHGWIE